MDPATIVTAIAITNPVAAAIVPPAAIPAVPVAPAIITPPYYETTTLAMANETIRTLPLLHPHPNNISIKEIEQDLFDKLKAIQSSQSEEWDFQ